MQFSKKVAMAGLFVMTLSAQAYDSETKVDTNNNSTSTSTVTSTNTNNNTNNNINDTTVNSTATNTNINTNTSTSTNTNNNNNVNTSTSTNTNTNVNTSTSTNTNNNTNVNINSGEQTFNNNNVNDTTINSTNKNENVNTSTSTNQNNNVNTSTSNNVNENKNTTKVEQPPPTAIAPSMMSGGNSDLCTTGTSGAVQTQILGVSSGGTIRDLNCERLKNAKVLYDMGMKVAAVATLCQDRRVWDAMWNAGTPCPYEGKIGEAAKLKWQFNPDKIPPHEEAQSDDFYKKTTFGAILGALLFGLF